MSLILTYNCLSDDATLTGGSWAPTLPLGNLQTEDIAHVTRSTDAALASTQFNVTLAGTQTLKTFLLGPTNCSTGFKYRLRAYSDAHVTITYDSGWVQPQAVPDSSDLEWEDPYFWLGLASFDDPRRGLWMIHVFDQAQTAQHWSVEIDDLVNSDGYVQFGRLFLGSHWVPSTDYAVGGNGLGLENASLKSTTLSGAEHFYRRQNPRVFSFGFDHLPHSEAFGSGFHFMRIAGFDGEVHVIPDPSDVSNLQMRSIFGRIKQMDQLQQAVWQIASMGFEIKEIL